MAACIVAALAPVLPWYFYTGSIPGNRRDLGMFDIVYNNTGKVEYARSANYDWHGPAISITAGVGFLFLLATSPLTPPPWWRTLGLGIFAILILTFLLIFAERYWRDFPIKEWGGFIEILAIFSLFLIVALEVRQAIQASLHKQPPANATPPV
jgi:4-amino-4-deoxy-L-arabinose transferase-like glycosyltransferase